MAKLRNIFNDGIAKDLSERIEREFKNQKVSISIKKWDIKSDRFIFSVELKRGMRESHIRDRVLDVQQKLKLPLFYIDKRDFDILIVASYVKPVCCCLSALLSSQEYRRDSTEMQLPYAVGYDVVGEPVTVDLAQFPHLLVGGASNSGKTVGLWSLVISIIYMKSPRRVNLILIDVGATDLISFNGIPHLSCPVVSDRQLACQVLISLMGEMERRINLINSDLNQFEQLPRLVLVVDEFPAIFTGMEDKQTAKAATNAVSGLLQRGRHAKIYVVLAAQNPTVQNMKVDIGNITARIAFRCAKKNYSETIIGEGGAENLLGKGDMYFKYPQHEGRMRIQGAYISQEELPKILLFIKNRWEKQCSDIEYKFTISTTDLQQVKTDIMGDLTQRRLKTDIDNRMFAKILLWVCAQDAISCNMLMREFNIGWKRANEFMERLYAIGVVEDLDAKLPRKVLKHSVGDFSEEQINLLLHDGVSLEEITDKAGNDS